jgi:hypothetical protein
LYRDDEPPIAPVTLVTRPTSSTIADAVREQITRTMCAHVVMSDGIGG